MIIFEALPSSGIRKALVILTHPHNHPTLLHVKATYDEKRFVEGAYQAAGKIGVTGKKLRTG